MPGSRLADRLRLLRDDARKLNDDREAQRVFDETRKIARNGDAEQAATQLRELSKRHPNDPAPLLMLAATLVEKGDLEEGAWTAARAADLRRNDPVVVFRAAGSVRWFNVAAARDYVEHVKRLLADSDGEDTFLFRAELLSLEGLIAFDEGDREQAIRLLEQGHRLEPDDRFMARDLAEAYMRVGQRSAALELIHSALEQDPSDSGFRRLLQESEPT